MPEVRTSLSDKLHRSLKEEAARNGTHLKDLIAKVLAEHTQNNTKSEKERR